MMQHVVTNEVVEGTSRVKLIKQLHEIRTHDGMSLMMVSKRQPEGNPHPVLLVHGLGQNRFSWHLSGRSFANFLVQQGYWTFNLELRGHGLSKAMGSRHPRDLEEYVHLDVPAAMDHIAELTGGTPPFFIGHSLGGMIGYRLEPRTRAKLRGMISVAGPFYFGQGNLPLRVLAKLGRPVLDLSVIRLVPTLPLPIDRVGRAVRASLPYWDFPYNFFPVQVWCPRSIERDLLRERIEEGFDRTSANILRQMTAWAAKGRFMEKGDAAEDERRLARFDTPLFCLAGDRDTAVPLGSIEPGFERVGADDKTLRLYGKERDGVPFGHCDLICGRHAPRIVWPEVAAWLDERR